MSRSLTPPCPKPHRVFVITGKAAVAAYLDGEVRQEKLNETGAVQFFSFFTLAEANAFMYGVEIAYGYDDAMAVDDLLI